MNNDVPTNLPEVLAYLTAKFTQPFSAGTNLPVSVLTDNRVDTRKAGAQESTVEQPMSGATGSQNSCGGQFISASAATAQTQPEAKAGDAGTISEQQENKR